MKPLSIVSVALLGLIFFGVSRASVAQVNIFHQRVIKIIAGQGDFYYGIDTEHYDPVNGNDFIVYKWDSKFNLLWKKKFGGTSDDSPDDIMQAKDGTLYILGSTKSADGDIKHRWDKYKGADVWLLNITEEGELLKERSYGGEYNESAQSIMENEAGEIIVLARARSYDRDLKGTKKLSYGNTGADPWIFAVDTDFNIVWQNRFVIRWSCWIRTITPAVDGGYIIIGTASGQEIGDIDNLHKPDQAFIAKLGEHGQVEWTKFESSRKQGTGLEISVGLQDSYQVVGRIKRRKKDCLWLLSYDVAGKRKKSKVFKQVQVEKIEAVFYDEESNLLSVILAVDGERYEKETVGIYLIKGRKKLITSSVSSSTELVESAESDPMIFQWLILKGYWGHLQLQLKD